MAAADDDVEALSAQLRGSVQIQLENMRDGMRQLGTGPDRLRDAGDALGAVVGLCLQSEGLIDNYGLIKAVSRTQRNFAVARRVYDELRALDARVARCASLLEADASDARTSFGDAPASSVAAPQSPGSSTSYGTANLLVVHMHVSRMAQFRAQTLAMMAGAPQTSAYSLQRYFRRLDELESALHDHVRAYARRLMALAEAAERSSAAQAALVALGAVVQRLPAEERGRFTAALQEWVRRRVLLAAGRVSASSPGAPTASLSAVASDPSAALEALSGVVLPDLLRARTQLVPRFPPALGVLDVPVGAYHRELAAVMAAAVAGAPERTLPASPRSVNQRSSVPSPRPTTPGAALTPPDIAYVLGWVAGYHEDVAAGLGYAPDHLEPPLLSAAAEAALVGRYVSTAGSRMHAWISTMLGSVGAWLRGRTEPPETDAHDRFAMAYGVDLFQIVREHVEMAAQAANGPLLVGVLGEAARAVAAFQKGVSDALVAEAKAAAARGAFEALEPYVLAVGNTALRWVSLQMDLQATADKLLGPEHTAAGSRVLRPLGDGWVALARTACGILADAVMATVRPAVAQLFTPAWYGRESPLVATVTVTFDDYLGHWGARADPLLVSKLVGDLAERVSIAYVVQMRAKGARLRPAAGLSELSADDVSVFSAWLARARDAERARRTFEPLSRWCALISAAPRVLALDFASAHKALGGDPALLALFDDVLRARDDLRSADVRETVEAARRRIVADDVAAEDLSASIFAKALGILRK